MSHKNLQLIQENIDLLRQGRPDRRGVRTVSPSFHGKTLQKNLKNVKEEYQEQKKIGEDFIFRIIKDTDKPLNFERLGLEVLAMPSSTIAIVQVKNPIALESRLTDFTKELIAVKNVVNYSDFANIDEFVFQTPEEKIGPLLRKERFDSDTLFTLDIQLYVAESSIKELHYKVSEFKEYLNKLDAELLDDCIMSNLVILKIKIKGNQIFTLLEHKNVYVADLPQNSNYNLKGINDYTIDNLPTVIPPSDDSPYVGILDSGVITTHPLLSGSVVDSASYGGLKNAFDENGHGTVVAGIIQYGDVYETLKNAIENDIPLIMPNKLLNARVTDKDNKFPDDKIVTSVVKDAIKDFAKEYNCKIFNLSLGDDRFPYVQATKMDTWSFVLDKLNHEHNLALVVSSGNYDPLKNDESLLDLYIDYLLSDEDASLIPPSLAVSCLSVGSIARDDTPYTQKSKLTHVPIAKKDEISPFSRRGFGYSNSVKPETVAYGGNYSLNTQTKRINTSDRNLGIFSTSIFNNTYGSWFETRPGTSFSAPYITHQLAKIKKELPDAKGNLLRALLMNTSSTDTSTSSTIIEKYKQLTPSALNKKIQQIQGFGKIREEYLTRSTDNYVTLFHESAIGLDKVNVFEIPIPPEIYHKNGKAKINITLAYNPPCKDSRIDYLGIKMNYQLYRGLELDEIMKYTCKPEEDEFEKDSLPKEKKKCKCSLTPSMKDVSKGTLLKTSHEIAKSSKSEETYGDTYYLVVKCQKGWYSGPKNTQEFAVVVSIEHENDKAQLYSQIQQRVQARIRGQVRTRR